MEAELGLQGYFAHKKHPPLRLYSSLICLGTDSDPRGVGVSYKRGTPVVPGNSQFSQLLRELTKRTSTPPDGRDGS